MKEPKRQMKDQKKIVFEIVSSTSKYPVINITTLAGIKENKKSEANFLIKDQIFKLKVHFYEWYPKCTYRCKFLHPMYHVYGKT